MFTITCGKGFQMKFPNGWTASVQWGYGNYCANYNDSDATYFQGDTYMRDISSATAEVWRWDSNGNARRVESSWRDGFENEDVRGRCTPDEVLAFLNETANLPQ